MDLRKHGWLGQGGNDMCACLCVAQSKKSTLMRNAAFEFFLSSGTMTDTFVDSSAELTSVLIFQMLFFSLVHTARLQNYHGWIPRRELRFRWYAFQNIQGTAVMRDGAQSRDFLPADLDVWSPMQHTNTGANITSSSTLVRCFWVSKRYR
jgi:hypothetical protein